VAASKGEGGYKNARTNEFTGAPTAIGKSEINENNAQAGSAGRANRDAVDDLKLPPGVKTQVDLIKKRAEQISVAITKAQADGMWDTASNPSQAKLEADLGALDKELRGLLKPYLPAAPAPKVDPAQARAEAEGVAKAWQDRVAAGTATKEQAAQALAALDAELKKMGLQPVGAGKPADSKPNAKPPAGPGQTVAPPMLETTTSATNKTMYRYKGQDQWYPTKVEALANLGKKPRTGMLSIGDRIEPGV
jgi:hypothetical protein